MMPNTRLFVLLLLLPFFPVQAIDHLLPDDSIFESPAGVDDYYSTVSKVFGKVLPRYSVKVIVVPSFQNECFVGLKDHDETCSIVTGQTAHSLWIHHLRENDPSLKERTPEYPENSLDVGVSINEKSLGSVLCQRINDAWVRVLLRTRYPNPFKMTAGLDGTTYHFSSWVRGTGILAGKIWSPEPETVPGKLVTLVTTMQGYSVSGSNAERLKLEKALITLELSIE